MFDSKNRAACSLQRVIPLKSDKIMTGAGHFDPKSSLQHPLYYKDFPNLRNHREYKKLTM